MKHLNFFFLVKSGTWIDLPHVTNGKGPADPDHAHIGPQAYLEEGPTVREYPSQVHRILVD